MTAAASAGRSQPPVPLCPTGCTDACPGGAIAHANHVRETIGPRIQAEWPVHKRPSMFTEESRWTPIHEPGGLPPGWHVVATRETPAGRRHADAPSWLHVVNAPAREATRSSLFRRSPAAPSVWGLVEQRSPTAQPNLQLAEVTLWRLWQMASAPHQPYWPMPPDGWTPALVWLRATIADRYDLTDENEAAEHTLYLLSGQFRTPPAAACT